MIKEILENIQGKHPRGAYGVIYELDVCAVSYYKYKSGAVLMPPKKAQRLIEMALKLGIKITYNDIYPPLF